MRKKRNARIEEPSVPPLALTHGQMLWLLSELGFHHGVHPSTFNYYVKSLRKLGIPFGTEVRGRPHEHVVYIFEDLMELALALLLRVYGTLPDAVAVGLRNFRNDLRPIYRQAYIEGIAPKCSKVSVRQMGRSTSATGLYLDLGIRYAAGRMTGFGPPRAVSPFEAACIYLHSELPGRACLPLNMSAVAKSIIVASRHLPNIGRGHAASRAIARRSTGNRP